MLGSDLLPTIHTTFIFVHMVACAPQPAQPVADEANTTAWREGTYFPSTNFWSAMKL